MTRYDKQQLRLYCIEVPGFLIKYMPNCRGGGRTALGEVTTHNIKQLKKLNSVVFPVSYNDKFYKDVLQAGELARLGKHNHCKIGIIVSYKKRSLVIEMI